MQYIISDSPDIETFYRDIVELQKSMIPFTYDYISDFTDPITPGGWGCARFDYPPPSGLVFKEPNVEYRYSDQTGKWQIDGQDAPMSDYVQGIHDYFVTLEGNNP
jgi:hypothetical protein